ncbi:hypothetical protein DYI25_14015 [Mesobacillus boroniphilus]|uniref:Uncharacterized protein n=1 Tax=Mesobacillus boroniphilus TaxID=308892 RepID=A0A944GXB4_9BACI|nr:hypothetical protein [Mesobacillus boroniphilus]
MKKPAVGLFHNSSRGKRSAWNEDQQPWLTEPLKSLVFVQQKYSFGRRGQVSLGTFTQFKLFCILLHEIRNIV